MSALKRTIKVAGVIVVSGTALLYDGEASAQSSLSAFEDIAWGASESALRQSSFGKNLLIKQCTAKEAAYDTSAAHACGSLFLPNYRMPGAEFNVLFYMSESNSLVRIRSHSMTTFSSKLVKEGFTAKRQYETLKSFLSGRWGQPIESNRTGAPTAADAPAITEAVAMWQVAASTVSLSTLYFPDSSGKGQMSIITIDYLPLDPGSKGATNSISPVGK